MDGKLAKTIQSCVYIDRAHRGSCTIIAVIQPGLTAHALSGVVVSHQSRIELLASIACPFRSLGKPTSVSSLTCGSFSVASLYTYRPFPRFQLTIDINNSQSMVDHEIRGLASTRRTAHRSVPLRARLGRRVYFARRDILVAHRRASEGSTACP